MSEERLSTLSNEETSNESEIEIPRNEINSEFNSDEIMFNCGDKVAVFDESSIDEQASPKPNLRRTKVRYFVGGQIESDEIDFDIDSSLIATTTSTISLDIKSFNSLNSLGASKSYTSLTDYLKSIQVRQRDGSTFHRGVTSLVPETSSSTNIE